VFSKHEIQINVENWKNKISRAFLEFCCIFFFLSCMSFKKKFFHAKNKRIYFVRLECGWRRDYEEKVYKILVEYKKLLIERITKFFIDSWKAWKDSNQFICKNSILFHSLSFKVRQLFLSYTIEKKVWVYVVISSRIIKNVSFERGWKW
jgi:hypothetical protein